jgi:GTP cyclohydrolase I
MAPRRRVPAAGRPPASPPAPAPAKPTGPSLDEATTEDLVRALLVRLGEDPTRDGLRKTPLRVAQSLAYLTAGATKLPKDVLNGAVFEHDADEMVVVRDIEVYSLCEHHMLPFFGRAHVAYLPRGKIVGLSKLPRIVDCFARRLQVQERLTMQIAEAVEEILAPAGVGVVIEAAHLCMMMRGVEKQNSRAVTSCMRGRFRTDARTRQEFLQILRGPSV